MNSAEKLERLDKNKHDLLEVINNSTDILINIIDNISNCSDKHLDFINFVEVTNIYEKYKWEELKKCYKNIKKKVTENKKLYRFIVLKSGECLSYFNDDIRQKIEDTGIKIKELIDKMVYDQYLLQKIHYNVINKCKYLVKNTSVVKINNINPTIKPVLIKLYENYMQIKITTKKQYFLKKEKKALSYEINHLVYK